MRYKIYYYDFNIEIFLKQT